MTLVGSVKKNIIANFAGSTWSALMGLAFIPFYIRLMGVEAYGIVGVFVSLQAMLAVLDLGVSQTLSREMARLSVERESSIRMADTVRTLEIIYWVVAVGIAALISLMSNFIVYHWLNPEHLSRESLLVAIMVMAVVIGLRWPVTLYTGGLNGLQRQVMVNALLAVFVTLQGAGALAVLWFVEPTIRAFFLWQGLIALIQVVLLRFTLLRSLPGKRNGAFRKDVLEDIWRFAAGLTGTSLLATILTQMDKVLLSKLLSLSEFGYYTFAVAVAGIVYKLVGPVFTAYYPRMIELVSRNNETELAGTYHQGCQLMAVMIAPLALTLSYFSVDVLGIWVRDPVVIAHSHLLVSLLVVGNALNGLMIMPSALQLSYGWTRLGFFTNVIAVIVLVPAIYFSTVQWGAVGAAGVWIVLNCGYLLFNIHLMHRRLLKEEKWRWYGQDVLLPVLSALLVAGTFYLLTASALSGNLLARAAIALTTGIVTMLSAALATPMGRQCIGICFKTRTEM